MKIKGKVLQLVVTAVLVMAVVSCASFEEKSSTRDGEIVVFDEVAFDGVVSLEDLENLGQVEVTRNMTYELKENGDWTVTMDNYSYTYSAAEGEGTETGTRVVGKLKAAEMVASEEGAAAGGGLGGLSLGGLISAPDSGGAEEESAKSLGPKDFAVDAINYDLLQAASEKGAMAILLPEYSWETERTKTGTIMNMPFMGPSETVTSDVIEYTVTARGTAVSF